jgi:FkbM family methyltransferase
MLNDKSLMANLANNSSLHARGTSYYADKESELLEEIGKIYADTLDGKISLAEIGTIDFPYFSFGNLDSGKLFGLDEIILFSFYYSNRHRYKSVLDLGANIGLHSLVLLKLGIEVVSYEPDELHCLQFEKVMKLNSISKFKLIRKAIGISNDSLEFTRVLGNTTGSFVRDAKSNPYGEIESFSVQVDDITDVLNLTKFDLVKMDVEGYEATLLNRVRVESFSSTDFMLEVGSAKNASSIFDLIREKNLNAFSQKTNWNRVKSVDDLPSHHSHGSLFIGNPAGPKWN